MLKFILAAFNAGVAYIDADGCLLKKFHVPSHIAHSAALRLLWWKCHLQPTPVIKRRLPLLYLLRLFGVRLVLWTNREHQHRQLTIKALGRHARLFDELHFRGGIKIVDRLDGPVMDDDIAYFTCAPEFSSCLLVKTL